jgi:hypothetical protein
METAKSLWDRIWNIGVSISWKLGGPTDAERSEQERRADELREEQRQGFKIRDTRAEKD